MKPTTSREEIQVILKNRHTLVTLLYVIEDKLIADLYFYGNILNIDESKKYFERQIKNNFQKINLKKGKTRSAIIMDFEVSFSPTNQLVVADLDGKLRKFTVFKEKTNLLWVNCLKNLNQYKPNNKTKRLIRHKLNRIFEKQVKPVEIDYTISDDEDTVLQDDDNYYLLEQLGTLSKNEEYQNDDLPSDQKLESELKEHFSFIAKNASLKTDDIHEVFEDSDSEDHVNKVLKNIPIFTPEMMNNVTNEEKKSINMLIEINFLQWGCFKVWNRRAILNKKCGNAKGDFLCKRGTIQYKSWDNRFNICVGISRLKVKDVLRDDFFN